MVSPNSPAPPRRVGRPRKRESGEHDADPRAQILQTASRLFAARGIADVSMFEIAQESGLVQSSLYYWFRRKELIVAELLSQVNRLPLAYAGKLKAQGASHEVQLYRLVRFDVRTVCACPLEITEVHLFSKRDKDAFATYWRERRELTDTIERLIEEGVQAGAFRRVNARLCAHTIIAHDESVQNWFFGHGRDKSAMAPEEVSAAQYCAEQVAEFVATQTVAGLLNTPARLDRIRQAAVADAP